jgi:hypothetical protein
MKTKITIFLFILLFVFGNANSQTVFTSTYPYSIEIPKEFSKKAIIGKNVDFKISDSIGNTVVVVVKKADTSQIKSAWDLSQATNQQWENALAEGLPNPKVIKKGETYLDNKEAFYIHYTTTEYKTAIVYYYIGYQVIYKGYQYVITATCLNSKLTAEMPVFYKIIQSMKFK